MKVTLTLNSPDVTNTAPLFPTFPILLFGSSIEGSLEGCEDG